MIFWTVQSKDVVTILLENGNFFPDFNLTNENYNDMKSVYPFLLNNYNAINKENLQGLLFGFSKLNKGKTEIKQVEDLYNYFTSAKDISIAFKFWSKYYCILKVNIPDNTHVLPIDFNDFTKLAIYATEDTERIEMLEMFTPNYSFKEDIENILFNFRNGNSNPIIPSFTQIHYSHLDINHILEVHPMIDYQNEQIYDLEPVFIELRNRIK